MASKLMLLKCATQYVLEEKDVGSPFLTNTYTENYVKRHTITVTANFPDLFQQKQWQNVPDTIHFCISRHSFAPLISIFITSSAILLFAFLGDVDCRGQLALF